jgi:hypothetical protein
VKPWRTKSAGAFMLAQMEYPQFRAEGWPLGSGMIESANKLVVEKRLKGVGMHWQEGNVNPMLALRDAWCNERWEERWLLIERERRRAEVVRRQARRAGRKVAGAAVPISPAAPATSTVAASAST